MQTAALIIASESESGAASWNTPSWVLIVLVITGMLSTYGSLATTLLLLIIRDIRDRLNRGDGEFKELHQKAADAAVQQALDNGAMRVEMGKTFVTRDDFGKVIDRLTALELRQVEQITAINASLENLCTVVRELRETIAINRRNPVNEN